MAEVGKPAPVGIVFIGFMGAGKSAAARGAAKRLGTKAIDADELLEDELGEPIGSFFEREGEDAFREREERLVLEVLRDGGVIALGGGAVESERVREALAAHVCAWCEVDVETAWVRSRGSGRPLAVDRDEFARRYEDRLRVYERVARAILPHGGESLGSAAAPWLAALRDRPDQRMVWAESASGSYPAIVGPDALRSLTHARELGAQVPKRLFCVGDPAALGPHGGLLPDSEAVIEVEGSEERKTLAEAERVLRELADAKARRGDALLAFGGGVIGDLAGFCAATYQRGIPVIHAPTTLVAQVDSAYGGKTGVDLPQAKNYIGAYHLPLAVLTNPTTLATLPREELAAGFVEVLKTALIAGGELWDAVRRLDSLDPDTIGEVIFACARTKIRVVAADERDSGRRAVLNLGHTVGHAIEAATGYGRYRHGEAVGLGLLAALRLSDAPDLRDEVRDRLEAQDLPTSLADGIEVEPILDAMAKDKKATEEGVGFVLLDRPGEPRWGERVDPDRVRASVEELTS
jgi:shikimate kinase/3-dehydroquinate synthase